MHRVLSVVLFILTCAYNSQLSADDTCPASCAAPVLQKPLEYPQQIARNGEFSADVTIQQPCSCTRRINLNLAFAPIGAKNALERSIPLQVAQGIGKSHVVVTAAELAKAKIKPGQFTIGFGLRDDRDQALGEAVSGLPFEFGSTQEALPNKPVIPASIGKDAELAVPFVFANKGDVPAHVTALLVFTRPDDTQGLEYYTRQLVVPPGGATHIVRVSAAKRRTLQIGAGPWLVTSAAFDAFDQRLAFYPGHMLMVGKTLSQPVAPQATNSVEPAQNLELALTFNNTGDSQDLVTAVLNFSSPSRKAAIEYKVEGLKLPIGMSTHPIVITAEDRYNLGLRPGRWRVQTTALDRAGKRIETRRSGEILINAGP